MWWMRSRYCLRNKIRSESSFPIIVKIAWEDIKDRNSLNDHCTEVFNLFSSCPKEYKFEIAVSCNKFMLDDRCYFKYH